MKYLFIIVCSLFWVVAFTQPDSARAIEPNMETSFENYELLIIAILGLAVLMGLRYWFKKTRKR